MFDAILLDRDGVINHDRGDYTYQREDLTLIEGTLRFMRWASEQGKTIIIITNQAGISRGRCTHKHVQNLMDGLLQELAEQQIFVKDYYYSPHYDDICLSLDRKPGSLMLEKAMARYRINPDKAVMIGDNNKDVEAAKAAGIHGIKVETNQGLAHLIEQI